MKHRKKTILVTAGPTREFIDPIRFISNRSSGLLGYEIAREARRRGYTVILISGPTALAAPRGVRFVSIVSTADLERAVMKYFKTADALFMTSAVCDYRPREWVGHKIKRKKTLTIRCCATPDILKKVCALKRHQVVCGFCLETEQVQKNALRKVREKQLDLIVAHGYGPSRNPFGHVLMRPMIIDKSGTVRSLGAMSKRALARHIMSCVEKGEI